MLLSASDKRTLAAAAKATQWPIQEEQKNFQARGRKRRSSKQQHVQQGNEDSDRQVCLLNHARSCNEKLKQLERENSRLVQDRILFLRRLEEYAHVKEQVQKLLCNF